MTRATIAKLRSDNGGNLPAWAWPGGYPLFYLDNDNEVLCPTCAELVAAQPDEYSFWPCAYDVHWEGDPLTCAHCNADIESAYGPVEADMSGETWTRKD